MDKLITTESEEFKGLAGQLQQAHLSVIAIREKHKPTIVDEHYMSGEQVMEYLHISPRTLQTLRDRRMIAFMTIGGKFLYPERDLQQTLLDNYRHAELPF